MGQNKIFTYPPGWSADTTPAALGGQRTEFSFPKMKAPVPPPPIDPGDHLPSLATEVQAAPISDGGKWWLTPEESASPQPPQLPRLPGPPAGFRPTPLPVPPSIENPPPWAGYDPTTAVAGPDYDPTAVEVDSAYGGKTTGHMAYGGPQLNNEGALDGLRRAAGQFQTPMISSEELQKQAARDPRTVAPGANQWAAGEIADRKGNEEFAALLGRNQQETASKAIAGQHPAVQAGEEQRARRASYPAQASAGATALAARLGLQGDTIKANASVESARAGRDARALDAIQRTIQELEKNSGYQETPGDRTSRLQEIADYKTLVKRLQAGLFYLNDTQLDALAGPEGSQ